MHKSSVLTVWASVFSHQCWPCLLAPQEFPRDMGPWMGPSHPRRHSDLLLFGQAPGRRWRHTQGTDDTTVDTSLFSGPWESSIHMVPTTTWNNVQNLSFSRSLQFRYAPPPWTSWAPWFVVIRFFFFALFVQNKMIPYFVVLLQSTVLLWLHLWFIWGLSWWVLWKTWLSGSAITLLHVPVLSGSEGRPREACKGAHSDPPTMDTPHCPLTMRPKGKTSMSWTHLIFQNLGKSKMDLHLVTHSIYMMKELLSL